MNHQSTKKLRRNASGSLPAASSITLKVNGMVKQTRSSALGNFARPAARERLDLTWDEKGCDHGQCGACTVLVNGKRINSCLTLLAHEQDGAEVVTIEGLAVRGHASSVASGICRTRRFQCGYCTPGSRSVPALV